MKEYIKGIPVLTLILLYLFFCGGIYLIGFWGTFEFDIYELLSIWEIPKSFFYPFSITSVAVLIVELSRYLLTERIVIFIRLLLTITNTKYKTNLNTKSVDITNNWYKIIYSVAVISSIPLYKYCNYNIIYWVTIGLLVSTGATKIVIRSKFFGQNIEDRLVTHAIVLLFCITPFTSFILGKTKGIMIYNNTKINLVSKNIMANIIDTSKISSIKLVGFLGDKLIASTLDNEKIIVLNQSDFNGVVLSNSKPEIKQKIDTAKSKLIP